MTDYEVPKWAGKPAAGIHLDVVKDGKLIQKIMVDEKKCYFFGRNPQLNDVLVDHQSCSRVHAALIYHKVLERNFLVDLGSTHGTFIGNTRIESKIPTQLPIDSVFHFGASTRLFTLKDKPIKKSATENVDIDGVDIVNPQHIPEDEYELDNLTEYNTVNNKRITMVGITDIDSDKDKMTTTADTFRSQNVKRKRESVRFKEEEDIINPEDVDPSVGKFRNLVQTEIITTSAKRFKSDHHKETHHPNFNILRPDHDTFTDTSSSAQQFNPLISNSLSIKLGIHLPNPAPVVDEMSDGHGHDTSDENIDHDGLYSDIEPSTSSSADSSAASLEKKKKYAKEAWPGRNAPGLF